MDNKQKISNILVVIESLKVIRQERIKTKDYDNAEVYLQIIEGLEQAIRILEEGDNK